MCGATSWASQEDKKFPAVVSCEPQRIRESRAHRTDSLDKAFQQRLAVVDLVSRNAHVIIGNICVAAVCEDAANIPLFSYICFWPPISLKLGMPLVADIRRRTVWPCLLIPSIVIAEYPKYLYRFWAKKRYAPLNYTSFDLTLEPQHLHTCPNLILGSFLTFGGIRTLL